MFASTYPYAVNNPIIYIDDAGKLPILINGRVDAESKKSDISYWDNAIINAMVHSGIPNPGCYAMKDIPDILWQLAKDENGKYSEKIQIYTHSRSAAFSEDYIKAILEYVEAHPDEFADPNKVIDLVYHIAPHQSWPITMTDGINSWAASLRFAFRRLYEGGK